jgi:hypothetical protein
VDTSASTDAWTKLDIELGPDEELGQDVEVGSNAKVRSMYIGS